MISELVHFPGRAKRDPGSSDNGARFPDRAGIRFS